MTRRQSAALLALAVVVAGWCALGIGVRATYGAQLTADEPQYVLSAISLAEDHDLDIADELHAERWRAFHSPARLPVQTKVLHGGRQVSPHDPLLPVLLAVPVAIGGWVGAKVALAVMAGALAALVAWTAWRRLGVPFGLAVAGSAVFAMSPPLAMYGTQVYPELPAALVVTAVIALVTGERVDRRSTVGLVLLLTALPWLSVKYLTVAAALAAVAAWRWWRAGRVDLLRWAGAALAISGGLFIAVQWWLYGGWTPYAAGSHFAAGEATVMGDRPNLLGRARRLVGLLVDRDFGLVPWQPAYLLLVPTLAAFGRRGRAWGSAVAETAAVLVVGWLTATFMALTMQGWWWPGRQVVVVLPCAVLLMLAYAPRTAIAAGTIGVVTYLWLVVDGLRHALTWVVDFTTTADPLYRVWRPLLPDGRSIADRDLALTAVWAVAALVVAAWVWGIRGVRARRATAALAAVAVLTAAAGGCADDGRVVRDVRAGVGSPQTNS